PRRRRCAISAPTRSCPRPSPRRTGQPTGSGPGTSATSKPSSAWSATSRRRDALEARTALTARGPEATLPVGPLVQRAGGEAGQPELFAAPRLSDPHRVPGGAVSAQRLGQLLTALAERLVAGRPDQPHV